MTGKTLLSLLVLSFFLASLMNLKGTGERAAETTHENAALTMFERILLEMKKSGEQFDPTELLVMGEEGTAMLLDFLMPESAGCSILTEEEIQDLIGELNHDEFSIRRHAIIRLTSGGAYLFDDIKSAAANNDPETAANASEVLRNIIDSHEKADTSENTLRTTEYGHAFGCYLAKLEHDPSWELIAIRTSQALCKSRRSTGNSEDFMWQSFQAIARRKNDRAMSLFYPLLRFGTNSSAEWVFTHLNVFSPKGFTPTVVKKIVQTDHVYNEAHLLRRLRYIRKHGIDKPYELHPNEVKEAFEALDTTWVKTKTFLSYEKAAIDFLLALPKEHRRFELGTPENKWIGIIKRADYENRTLTLETATEATRKFSWKDISLLKALQE